MKKTLILAALPFALIACSGGTADRKETLRLACLNEAEWPARIHNAHTTGRSAPAQRQRLKQAPEVAEVKKLCRQMDELTTADTAEKLPPAELAKACDAKVAAKKHKAGKGWSEHANRIGGICEEMTRGIK